MSDHMADCPATTLIWADFGRCPTVIIHSALQLTTPEPFDFKQPDNWPKWKKTLRAIPSGLATETEPRQVSTLLYFLGDEADDVLTSTNISADDKKNTVKLWKNSTLSFRSGRTLFSNERRSIKETISQERWLNNTLPFSIALSNRATF